MVSRPKAHPTRTVQICKARCCYVMFANLPFASHLPPLQRNELESPSIEAGKMKNKTTAVMNARTDQEELIRLYEQFCAEEKTADDDLRGHYEHLLHSLMRLAESHGPLPPNVTFPWEETAFATGS